MKQSPQAETDPIKPRKFDIVVYGASGFTGAQAAQYLATSAPPTLRLAIAGRSKVRLESVLRKLPNNDHIGLIVADAFDADAIDAMCQQAKVIVTTVGPYAHFGKILVERCVMHGVDYVDITGETAFVRELIDRYHERAVASDIFIVPCSGFDSVPSDLGTYFAVHALRKRGATGAITVMATYIARGGLNGGTIASGLHMGESGAYTQMGDLFLLNPESQRPEDQSTDRQSDPKWPRYNRTLQRWLAPFVMAKINTRVVRRSSALLAHTAESYGSNFEYQEFMECRPPLGILKALSVSLGLRIIDQLFRNAAGRSVIRWLMPAPGEGPSEKSMDRGFFRARFIAEDSAGERLVATVSAHGDPGNRVTVKALCESALALAIQKNELRQKGRRGGVLTPATAFGSVLVERLQACGFSFDVDTGGT